MVVLVTRLYLVRHGRAAAGWNVDPDPSLDDVGHRQAADVAEVLASFVPMRIVSSPLQRCQQTARHLAEKWDADVRIEPGVGEIPSPPGHTMETRVEWLREAMRGTWQDVARTSGAHYLAYRDEVVTSLRQMTEDTVIFSHFIAINVVIGAAIGDDRLVIASLDNCSVTEVVVGNDGSLAIDAIGREADTLFR